MVDDRLLSRPVSSADGLPLPRPAEAIPSLVQVLFASERDQQPTFKLNPSTRDRLVFEARDGANIVWIWNGSRYIFESRSYR